MGAIRGKLRDLDYWATLRYFSTVGAGRVLFFGRNQIDLHPSASVTTRKSATVQIGRLIAPWTPAAATTLLALNKNSELVFLGNVQIGKGSRVYLAASATLHIGDDTFINNDSLLSVSNFIRIGSGCRIGFDVKLMDSDFHTISDAASVQRSSAGDSGIEIADRVWIGAAATICKSVSIGRGAVVAAGSLVVRDVPADSLVGGVPAKVIKRNVSWEK